MVAIAGAGWRLASSLDALIDETDRLYPNRDHTSDGSIGDTAHAARTSDHNPDDGWVCAVDIDEDLSSALHTISRLAEHLIDDRDHRVKYLIYEGRICKAYVDSAGHPAWTWYPYTGLNDHSHHLHVSIWNTSAARDDRGAWWPSTSKPIPMEDVMNADQERLLRRVHDALGLAGLDDSHAKGNIKGRVDALYLDMAKGGDGTDVDLDELVALVQSLPAKTVAAIKAAL